MDSTQIPLFFDRVEGALEHLINVCGGRKKFAAEMWANMPARDAHNRLDACLNSERREKFSLHELILMLKRGRQVDCHIVMQFLAAECGYRAEPIEPENERARLQREFVESVKRLDAIRESLARIEPTQVRAVK